LVYYQSYDCPCSATHLPTSIPSLITPSVPTIPNQLTFTAAGCKITAHDLVPNPLANTSPDLHCIQGNISNEDSIKSSIASAVQHHGSINILCANAGITDESNSYPIWDMPIDLWEKTYAVNVRGTFLTVKHFLRQVADTQSQSQTASQKELDNVAIVLTGSECGVFGQAGHSEYASGKAALQYGLVKSVKNEIVRLNSKARINAVAPGWVDTKLIEGRLDDAHERWRESEGTVPLRKIAKPEDVARAAAFLASHRAAGHVSGQCLSVDGGMEGRIVWGEDEVKDARSSQEKPDGVTKAPVDTEVGQQALSSTIPQTISTQSKPLPKIKVLISVDFDAVSGWLGTGTHPDNNLADYSSGFFSAYVGVPRLLKVFKKLGIQEKVTWFVPMHSAESFPNEFKGIVESGCEVGLHGYCHEVSANLSSRFVVRPK
jgi:NAD(P)-dependent dehydrogenase (short-subunit alcohol dehydrogenase family)